MNEHDLRSRRTFLRDAGTLGLAIALTPEVAPAQQAAPAVPPVRFAVIGTGVHGREILGRLARIAGVSVVAICDNDSINLNRGKQAAPGAATFADYRALLDGAKEVQAVIVATPTHTHRPIVEAALQAEKHVYCEAPLAHTLDDTRAIARAALAAKTIFQAGLQTRLEPQHLHVLKFIRSGALGKVIAQGRLHYHKKMSWRRAASTPERDRHLNWRLDRNLSLGLAGELGIHQIDVASWFLRATPTAITGFGALIKWQDGRTVPDTVQCVLDYPGGTRVLYDATLVNSYDGVSELFMGDDSAVLLKDHRAWMFKEADAPLLGWEVYAKKEQIGDDNGIMLVADATKLLQMGLTPGKDGSMLDPGKDALYYALEEFVRCIRENAKPACGALEGLQATVVAIQANEAVKSGTRVTLSPDLFRVPT